MGMRSSQCHIAAGPKVNCCSSFVKQEITGVAKTGHRTLRRWDKGSKMRTIVTAAVVIALAAATQSVHAQADADNVLACGGALEGRTLSVTRSEAKCKWPFKVSKMQIRCNGTGPKVGQVYFVSEQGAFALNGSAKKSFTDARPIWLDIGEPGLGKIDIGPWIKVGLNLC